MRLFMSQLVSEIIEHTSASWHKEWFREAFLPVDAEVILQIPLCNHQIDDFWAWSEENRGHFSMRLAYMMIIRTKLRRKAWLEERED